MGKKKKKKRLYQECWDLDQAFFRWLEKRVKAYYKTAEHIVDLDSVHIDYDGVRYTQKELIKKMLLLLKKRRELEESEFISVEEIKKSRDVSDEIIDIWKAIYVVMWW